MTRATVLTACILALAIARPAAADSMIVFSITGIRFDATGFETDVHTPVSVTGVDTPQNSGVTVQGVGGGFDWTSRVGSTDGNSWYLNSTDIVIEAGFTFIGGPLGPVPGDIPTFSYEPTGSTFPFAMSMTGPALTFAAPVRIGIDPRLAAFYGLAPPCLALSSVEARGCTDPNPFIDTLLTGTGTPVPGSPGVYNFDAQIDAVFAPEPPSAGLVLATVALCAWIAVRRRRATNT